MAHNGEFYDFQRIRADLVAQGVSFSSKSDSEILLRLYEKYGIDESLSYLRGEFAFSLFDAEQDCLYLVSCLLYTSPSPRDVGISRMPSSA